MILNIIEAPDETLSLCSEDVEVVDDSIRKLFDDMLETMYKSSGVGLAAVQVGHHKRMFVMDVQRDIYDGDYAIVDISKPDYIPYGGPFFIINPEIIELSEEKISMIEGCLSVPGQKAVITRPKFVVIKFLDREGEKRLIKAQGWLARCMQHENDHLNGTLYINHLSSLKRAMAVKKLISSKKFNSGKK